MSAGGPTPRVRGFADTLVGPGEAASGAMLSAALILPLVVGGAGAAWGCPACGEAVASQSPDLAQGWARSIALLMSAPYLLFAGVTFYIIRSARRSRGRKQPQ